jgi:hypothetical protein
MCFAILGRCSTLFLSEVQDTVRGETNILIRIANDSSSSDLGLIQSRLMKIRVELSRARETFRAEKSSSRINACMLTRFGIYI